MDQVLNAFKNRKRMFASEYFISHHSEGEQVRSDRGGAPLENFGRHITEGAGKFRFCVFLSGQTEIKPFDETILHQHIRRLKVAWQNVAPVQIAQRLSRL